MAHPRRYTPVLKWDHVRISDMRPRVHCRGHVVGACSRKAISNKYWVGTPVWCDEEAASDQAAAPAETAAPVESGGGNYMK